MKVDIVWSRRNGPQLMVLKIAVNAADKDVVTINSL